jgi:NtrC-family two-component system sensor histidine kinase KinB
MADLIEVAELDSGKREPQAGAYSPLCRGWSKRATAMPMRPAQGIRLEIRAFADLSYMQADRRAVRTILDNLLSNALRYTPHQR